MRLKAHGFLEVSPQINPLMKFEELGTCSELMMHVSGCQGVSGAGAQWDSWTSEECRWRNSTIWFVDVSVIFPPSSSGFSIAMFDNCPW